MKKSIFVESNNVNDLEEIYDLYYQIKNRFEKLQTLNFKIQIEIEAI